MPLRVVQFATVLSAYARGMQCPVLVLLIWRMVLQPRYAMCGIDLVYGATEPVGTRVPIIAFLSSK
eukprot:1660762-Rhodomonas_salina.3